VDSLPTVARRKRKNPWTSTSEILLWLLFVALIFPAAFAGYAVGHYTSLGKPPATVTTTVGSTSTATPTTTTSATTTTTSSGGDVAAGKTLFTGSGGCAGCHTFSAAGTSGTLGPNLDNAPATDAKDDGNMALAAFIKESITNPSAYISKAGTWSVQMPPDGGASLSSTQVNDLVAFILSGTQQ
jgi:mono/diheme cytochrome c family protein